MKISTVLISTFLVISLVVGLISVAGIRLIDSNVTEMGSINGKVTEVVGAEIPKVRNLLQMKVYANDAANDVLGYIKLNNQQGKKEFYANVETFKTLSSLYKNSNGTSKEIELINQLDVQFTIFRESGNDLIAIQDSQNEKTDDRTSLNDKIVTAIDSLQKNSSPSMPDYTKRQSALMEMRNSMNEIISSSTAYLIEPDALLKNKVKDGIQNFESGNEQFLDTSLGRDEKIHAAEIKKYFESVKAESYDILALEDKKPALLEEFEKYKKDIDHMLDYEFEPLAFQKINEVEDMANQNINEVEDKAGGTTKMMFLAVVSSAFSAAVFGAVISRSISNPITKLRDAVKEMAKGNLDIKVKVRGNEEILAFSESLNSMADKLKTHDKLQKEFISVASHELRSPIQPILSFADLANKGHISQDQAWSSVLTQARRLQHLANDILYVTRIESDELTYLMQKVKINDIILGAVNIEKVNVSEGVSIETNLDKNVEIYADKDRITQALTNIIGNAVKFTEKGYIKVESCLLPGNKIEIKISDTAGGIPKEVLPKLFAKFATRSIGNANQHGTGLGLFISKAIINAHRGEISAYNNNEGGATFVMVLPLK